MFAVPLSAPVPVSARFRAAIASASRRFALDRQLDFWMGEIDPSWSRTEVRARVVDVVDETHDVKTFVLVPNARWGGHRAGQFVSVGVEIAGVLTTRCYSISSAPGDERLTLTVKRVPGGRVSSFLHDSVRRGHVLRLSAPSGDFVLPSHVPEKLLLVSGGSGVTPVMSILRDLANRDEVGDVVFLAAARSRRDVIFRRELQALTLRHRGVRVLFVLDDESGRIDGAKLRALVPDFAERQTFLCGPAPMMDALSLVWSEAGIADRLKTERFAAPALTPLRGAEKVRLTLSTSGRTVAPKSGATLLEQLESAGEKPANGCRMGICNTCRCLKVSGVVEDTMTGAISSAPGEEIRLCISRARSDVALDL